MVPITAAVVTIVVGIVVLLGWALDVVALRTFAPGLSNAMVVSTAICFVLAGTSLWLVNDEQGDRRRRRLGMGCASVVVAIGALKLSEYAFGWDLGIDQTLFAKNAGPFPGQMAIPTALSFVLAGAGLILLDVETPKRTRPAQILTLAAVLFPLLGIIGRLYGVPSLSRLVGGTVVMALHTALTFAVLCAGILAARSNRGLMRVVTSKGPGGLVLRLLLPGALAVVVLAGWVRLVGERSGLYGAEFGVALFAVFTVVLLSALIGRTASSLHSADLERISIEEKLRESEQRQKAILASLADGVVITDAGGVVVSINRAMERLSGWRQLEAEGLPSEAVCPLVNGREQPIEPGRRFLARAIAGREVVASRGFKISLLTKDGRYVPVSVASAPILDEEGDLLGGVDVLRDVSHEREVDQMKSSLISTVSHELRTPLTMIQGFSELLLTRDVDEKASREALRSINMSADRLGRLIEDLLSVSRIESGRLEVRATPMDLAEAVEDVGELLGQNRDIVIDVDDELPRVMADAEMLVRILTNLLNNATKYSSPESKITLAARADGSDVEVSVADDGIGMSEAEVAHLFDKFFRADRPEVQSERGTGLGLYITKNLVEIQGGRIWVESKPGEGTTFRFTLPLAHEEIRVATP